MINGLKIYSAPLQGFTDYVWRNAHYEIFGNVDKYYAPFMRTIGSIIPSKDLNDILPTNNLAPIHPQILATNPVDVQKMVSALHSFGYNDIDINLGCPHPPIALKKKGSGMLAYPPFCKAMFEALAKIPNVNYTIKMRLGYDDPRQWEEILPLFGIISPKEIVLHPRIGRQLYKGDLNLEQFEEFINNCDYPIIYNGDIQDAIHITQILERFPSVAGVMIGRGFLAHPDLLCEEKSIEKLQKFHEMLFTSYKQKLTGGDHQVLAKMKSIWEFMLPDADKKSHKLIKKSTNLSKYEHAVNQLFRSYELK